MGGKLPVAHLDLAGPFARRDDWAHVSQESLGAMTATTTASTRQGTRSRRGSSTGPSAAAADTDTDKLARRPSILQSVRGRLRHSQSASSISSVGSSAPTIGAASASSRRFKAPPHLGSPVNVTRESSKLDVDFSSVGRDHAPKQTLGRLRPASHTPEDLARGLGIAVTTDDFAPAMALSPQQRQLADRARTVTMLSAESDVSREPRDTIYSDVSFEGESVPPVPPLPTVSPRASRRPPLPSPAPPPVPRKSAARPAVTIISPASPLASMFTIVGLAQEPSSWVPADHAELPVSPDHVDGALLRWWKPDVLTTLVAGDDVSRARAIKDLSGAKTPARTASISSAARSVSKEQIASIQGKVAKLAFPKDVEIVMSVAEPPASCSFFDFTTQVPHTDAAHRPPVATGSIGVAWDNFLGPTDDAPPSSPTLTKTWHTCALTIWEAADEGRAEKIKKTLGASRSQTGTRDALKAAAAGRRLTSKLSRGQPLRPRTPSGFDDDLGRQDTESEWEDPFARVMPMRPLATSTTFWIPHALVLVSEYPIYTLLCDALRMSWARYKQDITSLALHMHSVLSSSAPRSSGKAGIAVGVDASQATTRFVTTLPAKANWILGKETHDRLPIWPLFKCLSTENILTAVQAGLAAPGRLLVSCTAPVMQALGALGLQEILEQRGWSGTVHCVVNVRDLSIYLEDSGPWIVAISRHMLALALRSVSQTALHVDLNSNAVRLVGAQAPPLPPSTPARQRACKKLDAVVGKSDPHYAVPNELAEAFPSGRFRPMCEVEIDGYVVHSDRLSAPQEWGFDRARVLAVLDEVLARLMTRTLSTVAKLLRIKGNSNKPLDESAKALRKHSAAFVERRDQLEVQLAKLNRKHAMLVDEAKQWRDNLSVVQNYYEQLNKETESMRTRLEKERQGANRLSSQMSVDKARLTKLESFLDEQERAKADALSQLQDAGAVKVCLEHQVSLLTQEIQTILAAEEGSPLFEAIFAQVESSSHVSDISSRSSNRPISPPMRMLGAIPPTVDEDEEDESLTLGGRTSRESLDPTDSVALRLAVIETVKSIQKRLSLGIQNAQQVDILQSSSRRSTGRESMIATLARNMSRIDEESISPDVDSSPAESPELPARGETLTRQFSGTWKPKPFHLTPPVSSDTTLEATANDRKHRHTQQDSVASVYWDPQVTETIETLKERQGADIDEPEPRASMESMSDVQSFVSCDDASSAYLRHHRSLSSTSSIQEPVPRVSQVPAVLTRQKTCESSGTDDSDGESEDQTMMVAVQARPAPSPQQRQQRREGPRPQQQQQQPTPRSTSPAVSVFTRASKRRSIEPRADGSFRLVQSRS